MCARSLLLCVLGIIVVVNGKLTTTLTLLKLPPFAKEWFPTLREKGSKKGAIE